MTLTPDQLAQALEHDARVPTEQRTGAPAPCGSCAPYPCACSPRTRDCGATDRRQCLCSSTCEACLEWRAQFKVLETPDLPPLPSPIFNPQDAIDAIHAAETALRTATELITFLVQRAADQNRIPLAAVIDARNAELKRAALMLGLTANDARTL